MANSTPSSEFEPILNSHRVVMPGAKAIGVANPHQDIEVTLKLRRKQPLPKITGRPTQLMTREQLADEYGAAQPDIDAVVKTYTQLGLKNTFTDAATRTVKFSGSVAEMEKAFQVKLFNYSHPDGTYRGREGYVHVPKSLSTIIEAVFGLDNRRIAHRRKQVIRQGPAKSATAVSPSWYTSAELATHYHFPAGDGDGQTIGILEFGGGYFAADLQQYCQLAGTAMPNVVVVSTDGTSTSAKDGAEGEVMMDVEVVAGVCPKATIVVYFAEWSENGWITALDAAVQDRQNNPMVISASWGSAEDTDIWTKQAIQQFNETLQEAAQLGITICVAAGDDGSSDADNTGGLAHVDFPASSPYVLAVGGTTIPKKGVEQPDVVWFEGSGVRNQRDSSGSTGGGVSAVFPRPDWQKAITIKSVNPSAIAGRVIPDIAANADWVASPYLLVVDGSSQGNGGTSAAAPLIASLIALINASLPAGNRVGFLTPVLYQAGADGSVIGASCCTDVISGGNKTATAGGYDAGPGYDAVSGWGTPNGSKLAAAIAKLPAAKV